MRHEHRTELELAGRRWLISKAGNIEDLWNEMTGGNPGIKNTKIYRNPGGLKWAQLFVSEFLWIWIC